MSKWTSIKDGLPKEENKQYNVLCDSEDGEYKSTMWFNGKNWCFDNEGCPGVALFETSWYIAVTHWQPLPPLPGQEEYCELVEHDKVSGIVHFKCNKVFWDPNNIKLIKMKYCPYCSKPTKELANG